MEVLQDTPLLKFNKNTIQEVRKELNLTHDDVVKILDSFEEWISKQNHFTMKEFDRHYLESSLIYAKGSLERAKASLDKLCTMRTLSPNFFSKYDAKKELKDSSRLLIHGTHPKLMKDNYRFYFIKMVSSDLDSNLLLDYYRYSILMNEYLKRNDYSHGFHIFIDGSEINIMSAVTKINVLDLRHTMSVFMEGSKVRIKAIHILSASKAIDAFVALLKQVLSEKISGRIHAHKTLESVYEHIPKEYLPKEYGGDGETSQEMHDNWVNVLSMPENVAFFKKMNNARSDEKYRLGATYNEQILGLPGSFRTLTVD